MQLRSFQYLGKSVHSANLDGLGLAVTHYPPDQVQPWHEHENPTVFMLLRGDFTDKSAALGERTLGTLDMVCHPAGVRHAGEAGPRGRSGINIEPTKMWLESYCLGEEQLLTYRVGSCPETSLAGLRLALALAENELAGDIVIDSVIPLLISRASAPEESSGWFAKVESLLGDKKASLRTVAQEVAVHPVYLARVFRSRFGCSLGEYVLRKRISDASRAVLNGSSLAEAACDAGFSDQAHLSKLFRREIGWSPGRLLRLKAALAAG